MEILDVLFMFGWVDVEMSIVIKIKNKKFFVRMKVKVKPIEQKGEFEPIDRDLKLMIVKHILYAPEFYSMGLFFVMLLNHFKSRDVCLCFIIASTT